MIDPVPWFVGGGAHHSPETARALAWTATGGNSGIFSPEDFKVSASPVPGENIRIAPGGGAMVSRYPGASQQSYTCRGASSTDVKVAPTGSAGAAVRYVILRVEDPQYAGQAVPADVKNGPYIYPVLVPSLANLPYPFLQLARIDQPASTAAITNAMITDIRRLARPNSHTEVPTKQGFANVALSKTDGFMLWPGWTPQVFVPEWANQAKVLVTINGAKQAMGPTFGNIYTRFCGQETQHVAFDSNTPNTEKNIASMYPLMDRWDGWIPANLRGTMQGIEIFGRRNVAPGDPGYVNADSFTQVIAQVVFGQTVA